MNQSTSASVANLQLHHNFRWVLCSPHSEPVRGFLSRYLRRRLISTELQTGLRDTQLERVVNWLPTVLERLNKFLDNQCSSDLTIGPRLFLPCPMNTSESHSWFTDLWNFSIVPYLLEAVRDGVQAGGPRTAAWEDPTDWVVHSYPWSGQYQPSSLFHLHAEDVSQDHESVALRQTDAAELDPSKDSLMNMLRRLQGTATPPSATELNQSPQRHHQQSAGVAVETHNTPAR